jgi:hypothetical protein
MPHSKPTYVVGIATNGDDVDDVPVWRWWLETAAIGCLALAAVLGPLALGGTHAYGRLTINLLVAAATFAWILSAPRSGWLAWVPLSVAGLAMIQVVPLPFPLLALVAPFSQQAWATLDEGQTGGWGTISVDPGATAAAIRQLFLGLSAIVVTMDLCREPRRRFLLAVAISLSGLIIWGLALAFPTNDEHLLLGRVKLKDPEAESWWSTTMVNPVRTSGRIDASRSDPVVVGDQQYDLPRWLIGEGNGPYIVSDHFAAGMYLTIPILLGLCRQRLRGPVWAWAGATLAMILLAAATWTVGMSAHSRAGGAAMLLAAVVFMALSSGMPRTRQLWGIALAVTAATLAGFVLAFFRVAPGLLNLVPGFLRGRIESAAGEQGALTQRAMELFLEAPLFGTGLGTFGYLQRRFVPDVTWAFYAHDDYAQLLAESGLCGAAVFVALAAVLGRAFLRTWRAPEGERLLAAGAWAALAAIGLHSFFDWNMHVPANALFTCLVAGLALSTVATFPTGCVVPDIVPPADVGGATPVPWSSRRGSAAVALAGACVVVALLSVRDLDTEMKTRRLRSALMSIRSAANADARTLAIGRLQWGIVNARRANRRNPTDAELPLLAGQAALHLAAEGESLVGEEAEDWFGQARQRNPFIWGLPQSARLPAE